jgi:hypothetical protein
MSGLPSSHMPSAASPTASDWTTAGAEAVVERALTILDEERSTWSSRREAPSSDGGADREV